MIWPEEEQRNAEEHNKRFWGGVEATSRAYRDASWRKSAVKIISQLVDENIKEAKRSKKLPQLPNNEAVIKRLKDKNASEALKALYVKTDQEDSIFLHPLLAECSGRLFCGAPTVLRWQMVALAFQHNIVAWNALLDEINSRLKRRPKLIEDIRKVAQKIQKQSEFVRHHINWYKVVLFI